MTVCWEAAHKEPCEVGFSGVDPGVRRVGWRCFFVFVYTPEDETWNMSSWRFGDHFPFFSWVIVGEPC